jgi:hypothetical protein
MRKNRNDFKKSHVAGTRGNRRSRSTPVAIDNGAHWNCRTPSVILAL